MSNDPFASALASLPSFIEETNLEYADYVDWVLDQCDWTLEMISDVELSMIAEIYDEISR